MAWMSRFPGDVSSSRTRPRNDVVARKRFVRSSLRAF